MNGLDMQDAVRYVVSRINPREFKAVQALIPSIVQDFWEYDLRFMHQAGVLNEQGNSGDGEYDDDDAFEYILESYLSASPCSEETEMVVAELLQQYMELQYQYLLSHGLAGQ